MKADKYLAVSILFQSLLAIIQMLLPMYGLASVDQASDFRVLAVLASFIPGIIIVFFRNIKSLIIPFLLYAILLLIHYVVFPASHTFIEGRKAITLTPICILTGIFIYNLHDLEAFRRVFIWVCRVSIPLAVLFIWGNLNSTFIEDDSTYSMSFGYTLLLPTLYLFSQDKAIDKVGSILLWLLIIYGASRGPAVTAAVFYIICILFYENKKKKSIIRVVSFLVLIVLGFILVPRVLDFQSSRTVLLFEEGEGLSHDSDRAILYAQTIERIKESPVIGNGIGSDWYYLGGYCHNFFLELSLHYGILVSVFICVVLIFSMISIYRNKQLISRIEDKQLFVLIMIASLVPLMVSSSYLLSSTFGLAVGYLLRYRFGKKKIMNGNMITH